MLADISLEQNDRTTRIELWLFVLAFASLLAAGLALSLGFIIRGASQTTAESSHSHWLIFPIWAVGVWYGRRLLNRIKLERDPYLFPIGMLLAGWGLLAIWRVTPLFGMRQTLWFVIALLLLFFIIYGQADLRWLRRYRYLWLAGGLGLVFFTLLFGTNPSGGEPRLWLGCCGMYFQPSEPLRLLLVAYMASYLADYLLLQPDDRQQTRLLPTYLPLLIAWGISVLLLMVQRDLGTGTLFLLILAVMLFLSTGQYRVLAIAFVLVLVGTMIGYSLLDVVRLRIGTWMNPWAEPAGSGYQIIQSLISIASGGLWGTGPGMGSPGFIPVVHSDFIFAALVEEWGLFGGIGLIIVYAFLVQRGLSISMQNQDPFRSMLAAGIAVAFALQGLIIMAGVIRLLPLTGVTLPFISYGGSSLVTSFVGLGFLLMLSGESGRAERMVKPVLTLQIVLSICWLALALVLGYWIIYRGPGLLDRLDNPRTQEPSVVSFTEHQRSIVGSSPQLISYSHNGAYLNPFDQELG